jgi:PAS domain S-box-containing protein
VEVSISSFQVDDEWFAVGTVRDITERKRSEDRLNLTQNTVDKAALSIFWVDPESGYFIYANEAACSSIGYTREELLAMIVPEIDVGFFEKGSPSLLQVLDGNSQVETEGVYRTKDGRLLNVLLSIVLTELENRRIIAVFARDITEQKRAEEALTQSEERSRLILNSAGDGIFGVNTKGLVTFMNPNALKMLGFKEEELVGNQIHPIVHHHRSDGTEYPVEECPVLVSATQGATHHIEDEVLWRKDGTFFPVEYTSKPIIRDRKIAGAVVTFRDITDRLKSEQELKQKLEELEQFSELVVGREEKMIGLKEEINGLLVQLDREEKYEIVA